MAVDVEESLTRKLGPLPTWAWGVVVAGGVLVARKVGIGLGGSRSATPTVINPPVSTPTDPTNGPSSADDAALVSQVNELSTQLQALSTSTQTSNETLAGQLADLANTVTSTASSEVVTKIRDLMVQLNNLLFQREQHLHNFDFSKSVAYQQYQQYRNYGGTGGGSVASGTSAANKTKALSFWADYQRLQAQADSEAKIVDGINAQITDLQSQLQGA